VVLVELAGRHVVGSGFVLAVLALAFGIVSGGGTFRATVVPLATAARQCQSRRTGQAGQCAVLNKVATRGVGAFRVSFGFVLRFVVHGFSSAEAGDVGSVGDGRRLSGFRRVRRGNQRDRRGQRPRGAFALLALLYHRWALVVVDAGDLAIQAVVAFVEVDAAIRMDRLDLALVGADLAGAAALGASAQPFEQSPASGHGQSGTQRADIAAIELVVERGYADQQHRVEHVAPRAREVQGERGL